MHFISTGAPQEAVAFEIIIFIKKWLQNDGLVFAKGKTVSVLIIKRQKDISVRIREGSQVTIIYVEPSSSDHQMKNAAKEESPCS